MSNHYMTKTMTDRLFKSMRKNNVKVSQIYKALNIDYPNFKAVLDGKSPCYNKWQKKISEILNEDREVLFGEFIDGK